MWVRGVLLWSKSGLEDQRRAQPPGDLALTPATPALAAPPAGVQLPWGAPHWWAPPGTAGPDFFFVQ